ncbi:hypothetical protein [Lactococcus lactis]|uniref:hypothetical protein n=1 Tax=Lactococcus lactis TaxID=1358 RepID=UPI001F5ADE43|nr:hypothetical protein [Lactococcus lactis]
MKEDLFNRKNVVMLVLMVGVFLLLGSLSAGVVYLSGIGTKSQYSTAQGKFKSTHSSSVEQSSKGGGTKTSKSEVSEKKASMNKTELSTNVSSSSEQAKKVADPKQENQCMTTTEQKSHVITPVIYVATYNGFTGYSTVSYDEALAIARSLSENQKPVTENTQEITQQSTQQNTHVDTQESVQQELEKIIASIQEQNPNTQINIVK